MTRNSVTKDIKDLLTANQAASGPFFADQWGKGANNEILSKQTIVESTPGGSSEIDESYEQLFFSLTFRGDETETNSALWDRAILVHNFLTQTGPFTINSTLYKYASIMAPLQALGRDDKGHPMAFVKYFTYRDVR